MIAILKKILKDEKIDVTNEQIEGFLKDILAVISLEIVSESRARMNQQEIDIVSGHFKNKEYNEIVDIVRNKYSSAEWHNLIEKEVKITLDDYLANVIKG